MFAEWLVEAYYLRLFLQLQKIPHYTTLQKFAGQTGTAMLDRIISSFVLFFDSKGHVFAGIDLTGFKITCASQYYTVRSKLRSKYAKLSIGADVLAQIICTINVRRGLTRHDNVDFKPIVTKMSEIKKLSAVVADRGYDSEDNHVLVRQKQGGYRILPARNVEVPVWKIRGRYRKKMNRGYSKLLYHQRNKEETIISVIKRLFGEHITSCWIRMQDRELIFRCIAYNIHRMVNLLVLLMVSTEPC